MTYGVKTSVAQPHSLDKEVTVTTDAQEEHSVFYVSRKLSSAEPRIERDTLAIVFAATRLKQSVLGRKLSLQTDHEPLQHFFVPDGEKLKTALARSTRKGIAVMGYYKLKYVSGEQIPHVAALGRLRFNEKTPEEGKIGIFQKDIFFADN